MQLPQMPAEATVERKTPSTHHLKEWSGVEEGVDGDMVELLILDNSLFNYLSTSTCLITLKFLHNLSSFVKSLPFKGSERASGYKPRVFSTYRQIFHKLQSFLWYKLFLFKKLSSCSLYNMTLFQSQLRIYMGILFYSIYVEFVDSSHILHQFQFYLSINTYYYVFTNNFLFNFCFVILMNNLISGVVISISF